MLLNCKLTFVLTEYVLIYFKKYCKFSYYAGKRLNKVIFINFVLKLASCLQVIYWKLVFKYSTKTQSIYGASYIYVVWNTSNRNKSNNIIIDVSYTFYFQTSIAVSKCMISIGGPLRVHGPNNWDSMPNCIPIPIDMYKHIQ